MYTIYSGMGKFSNKVKAIVLNFPVNVVIL